MLVTKAIISHAISGELVMSFLLFIQVTIFTEYVEVLLFTHNTSFLEE